MDLARTGGKTKWMEALGEVEVEVGEGFQGWDQEEGGSRRWICTDLGRSLAAMVDQVATTILSLGLEVWVRAAQAGAGIWAVEVGVTEGMEEAGMGVLGGMTIVIAIAITMEEVTTGEGGEAITEVVGVVIVNVGEVVAVVAGDTKLLLVYASLKLTLFVLAFRTQFNRSTRHFA